MIHSVKKKNQPTVRSRFSLKRERKTFACHEQWDKTILGPENQWQRRKIIFIHSNAVWSQWSWLQRKEEREGL